MKNLSNVLFLAALVLIICFMLVGILFFPHTSFSQEENRALSPPPKFRIDEVLSGRFFSRLSDFCADSIPLRTQMIKAKALCELAIGKSINNNVAFLQNGRLVDRLEYTTTAKLTNKLTLIKSYSDNTKNFACAIVPRAADIYLCGEQTENIYGLVENHIGEWTLCDKLKNAAISSDNIYYKTDHHLDSDGAYILYCHVVSELGFTPLGRECFEEQVFCTDFVGTTYSKSGLLPICTDTITLLRYENDTKLKINCHDEGCTLDSLYSTDAKNIKDKYRVFTNGNHGIIEVRDTSAPDRPTLLIYKDSFANAALPMLARHFDLVVCDPRYTNDTPPQCDYTAIIMGVDTLNG